MHSRVNSALKVTPAASMAVTRNVNDPLTVGVPLRMPSRLSVSPAGSWPLLLPFHPVPQPGDMRQMMIAVPVIECYQFVNGLSATFRMVELPLIILGFE